METGRGRRGRKWKAGGEGKERGKGKGKGGDKSRAWSFQNLSSTELGLG